MSRSWVLRVFVLVWLTIVWIWLWGDISFANLAGGLAVALLIMIALPLPRVAVEGRLHPLSLLYLLVISTYYALESSVQVAWLAVRPAPPPVTGVLRVQLAIKSDLVVVLLSDVINLIPGTLVLEIDRTRRTMLVHVLDIGSDRAVEKFYRTVRRLEELFIATFERPSEWHEERVTRP
ncbi:MAG TPA: Na+/H+ antiporter subunit E [Aldersonia sp.]